MATSGVIYGTTNNPYIEVGIWWSTEWSDADTNQTSIVARLWARRTNTGYVTSGTWSGGITIDGQSSSGSRSVSIGTDWVLLTGDVRTVTHNSDGNRSVAISAWGGISGTGWDSTSVSGTAVLDRLWAAPPKPVAITPVWNLDTNATVGITHGTVGSRNEILSTQLQRRRVSTPTADWVSIMDAPNAVTSFEDTGIAANSAYQYRSSTWNWAGQTSFYTSPTYLYTTPGAPSEVTATAQTGYKAKISWKANDAYTPQSYNIYDNGALLTTVSGSLLTYTHDNPDLSVAHVYSVSALQGNLESTQASASSLTLVSAPPKPVLSLSGNYSASHALSWTYSGDTSIATFTVTVTKNGVSDTSGTPVGLGLTLGSRTAGATYSYTVTATNPVGSNTSIAVAGYGAVLAPALFASTGFTPPNTVGYTFKNNNTFAATAVVEHSGDNATWTALTGASVAADTTKTGSVSNAAFSSGTAFLRVRYTSPAATAYATFNIATITVPNAPSNVTIARTLGSTTTLTASWSLNATAAKPIDKVEWEWVNGSTVTNSDFGVTSTSTSLTIGLNTGRFIRVRTSNSAGSSAWVTSSVATGFVTAPNFTGVSLLTSSGLPVTFSATANTALSGYIMKVQFCTSDDTVIATLLNELASGAKLVTFPYFDASNKLNIGNYKFTAVLCEPDGTVISTVTSSSSLARANIVAPESFSANNTGITVSNAAPYSAQRVISFSVKPYKTSQTALTGSVTQSKTQSSSSASYTFVDRALKAPIVLWSATVTGKYDDGSTAWSKTDSGTITKGQALYVGNDVVMPHVISSDGIVEVFPEVII